MPSLAEQSDNTGQHQGLGTNSDEGLLAVDRKEGSEASVWSTLVYIQVNFHEHNRSCSFLLEKVNIDV